MRRDPYRGLVPYSEEDAEYFFGRDRDRQIIASNLTSAPFTLLYGPSGVGKTSVLRAGVVRDLRHEARRNRDRLGLPEFAVAWLSEWRGKPVAALEAAVRAGVADAMGGDGGPVPGETPLERLEQWCERLNGELFLIFDQFEEYFLYHPTDTPGDFAELLTGLVTARELPVNVLVSLRDDALSQMDRFKGRIPGLFSNFLRIDRLDREAGRLAIDGPVARWNEAAQAEGPAADSMTVEEAMREAVLDQVRVGRQGFGEKGRGTAGGAVPREEIETPFLQLVMQRIWSEERDEGSTVLRFDTLERLGGAEEILRTHLSRVLDHLEPQRRKIARKIFYYLVTPSGAKIAHSATDLASYTELDEDAIAEVLARLCDRDSRILREVASADGGDAKRYEIYHDVLGGAILEWQRETRVRAQTDAILAERDSAELSRQARLRTAARFVFGFAVAAVLLVGVVYLLRATQIENQRLALRQDLAELRGQFFDTHQAIFRVARTESATAVPDRSPLLPGPGPTVRDHRTTATERLKEALEAEIGAGLISMRDDANSVTLVLPHDALFRSGSTDLIDGAHALLDRIAEAADQTRGTILVAGHTDNIPTKGRGRFRNNLDLSLARAEEVRHAMADTMSQPGRLLAEGRGETEPVADNATAAGRAMNRRVEIIIRKAS